MKDKKGFVVYILLSIVIWQLADTISKLFIKGVFPKNPIFDIMPTQNTGIAFGLLDNNPLVLGVLGIVTILIISFIVYKKISFSQKFEIILSSIFVGGILGNSLERLINGVVLDFIKLNFIDFPIFNLYDVLICTSVLLYIVFSRL